MQAGKGCYNTSVKPLISVVIPNRNGRTTIGRCIEAALASEYPAFEVIVADDCSDDGSCEIISRYPCRLIRMEKHCGAGKARNAGASAASGEILFFTDADCLIRPDTLVIAGRALADCGPGAVIGGTYTSEPADSRFFSRFQSVFVNYSETRSLESPDYIAGHALAMYSADFRESGGFPEDMLPILEDVAFSHRLRQQGYSLRVVRGLVVRHIFDYSLFRSMRNAWRKSRHWTAYSLANRDILANSGTASAELKINVLAYCIMALLVPAWLFSGRSVFLYSLSAAAILDLWLSRGFIRALYRTGGTLFAFLSTMYYMLLYPAPIAAGAAAGLLRHLLR